MMEVSTRSKRLSEEEIETESIPLLPSPFVPKESTGSDYSDGHPQGTELEESPQEGSPESGSQINGPYSRPDRVQMAQPASNAIQNSPDVQLLAPVNNNMCNLDVVERRPNQQASANAVDSHFHLSRAQIETRSGRADSLELLLKNNADVNVKDDCGRSLLHLAVDGSHYACLEVLLKTEKVDINCVDYAKSETPIFAAVQAGWLEGVKLLMRYQPEIEKMYGKKKKSVLQQAIQLDNVSVVRLIVEGARAYDNFHQIINAVNDKKMTPLFTAILRKKIELVKILLEAQADVTLHDEWKRNVLHCAAETRGSDFIKELFKHNPTEMKKLVHERQERELKGNPLHIAIHQNDYKSIKYLIEVGKASLSELINTGDYKNCNILHFASVINKKEAIKYLTEMLLNPPKTLSSTTIDNLVGAITSSGETPLQFAIQRRQVSFVQALIMAGANLATKCVDKSGRTRTAIDILIHQLPSSVQILSNILDESIKKDKKDMSVVVDYKVLMSPAADAIVESSDCFGVLNALRKTGDRLGQKKLLEHPLVESFVHLHWKRLESPYTILVVLNVIFAILLSLLVLFCLILESPATIITLRVLVITFMVPLFTHQAECLTKNQPLWYHAEAVMRLVCFALTIWACFPQSPPQFSALGVLLAWFEVMLLISRIPHRGYYMLMFIEIALKYTKLLFSFLFVLFGFLIAFMAFFELKPPFDSFLPALMKTVVMMTNEFEYDSLSKKFETTSTLSPFSQLLGMVVFILFIVFIGLVLTNLFVAVAVIDINKIHIISKQTEFLGVYETLLFSKSWLSQRDGIILTLYRLLRALVRLAKKPKWVEKWDSFAKIESSYKILIDDEELRFPEELNSALVFKGYANHEKMIKKCTEENKHVKDINAANRLKLEENQNWLADLREMITAVIREENTCKHGEVGSESSGIEKCNFRTSYF